MRKFPEKNKIKLQEFLAKQQETDLISMGQTLDFPEFGVQRTTNSRYHGELRRNLKGERIGLKGGIASSFGLGQGPRNEKCVLKAKTICKREINVCKIVKLPYPYEYVGSSSTTLQHPARSAEHLPTWLHSRPPSGTSRSRCLLAPSFNFPRQPRCSF